MKYRSDEVSPETVSNTAHEQLACLDPRRAEALSGLQMTHAARANGYVREQRRLALKYGENSQQKAAVAQKLRFTEGFRRDLDFEVARAKTATPTVHSAGYVFHGFVHDLKKQPLPHLTVALYDQKGNWIQDFGYGCTNEQGYFLIRADTGKADQMGEKMPISGSVKTGGREAKRATDSQAPATVQIRVLNDKQTTIQVEKEPLYPKGGQIDFRMIIVSGEPVRCTPPQGKPSGPVPPTKKRNSPG